MRRGRAGRQRWPPWPAYGYALLPGDEIPPPRYGIAPGYGIAAQTRRRILVPSNVSKLRDKTKVINASLSRDIRFWLACCGVIFWLFRGAYTLGGRIPPAACIERKSRLDCMRFLLLFWGQSHVRCSEITLKGHICRRTMKVNLTLVRGKKTTLLTTVLRSRTGIRVGLKTRKGIWEPIITGNEQNRLISRNVPERNDYLPIT